MLAQKRNRIMYQNMFSNFFIFPIGQLTHPPTFKVFLEFWNYVLFTWPLSIVSYIMIIGPAVNWCRLIICNVCIAEYCIHFGFKQFVGPMMDDIADDADYSITYTA